LSTRSRVRFRSCVGSEGIRDDPISLIVLRQRLAAANVHLEGRLICFETCTVHVVALEEAGEGAVNGPNDVEEQGGVRERSNHTEPFRGVIRLQNM